MTKINFILTCADDSSRRNEARASRWFCLFGVLFIFLASLAPVANAGCGCSAIGNWDPSGFLNSELGTTQPVQVGSTQNSAATASAPKPVDRIETYPNNGILISAKSVSSSDLVVDVSSADSYAKSHIKKAINIPIQSFLNGEGDLKTDEELAQMLGEAGISRDDSVVIYGSSESSGEPELAFWVLQYLGHENVKAMDGSLTEWTAAGLPVESSENRRPAVDYLPNLRSEYIVDYEYVKSGQAMVVDARPFTEFGKGRIPGSTALDPDNVIKGNLIKNGNDLNMVFSRLPKDQPIVVYSNDYSRSSLVWYALQLMGYKSSIYTWDDWKEHEFKDVKEGTATAGGNAASPKYVKLGRI